MSRKFFIALLPVAACVGIAPTQAAPTVKTVSLTGTAQAICKIGASTSYAVSMVIGVDNGATRSVTANIDGAPGNLAMKNATSTATQTYATFCNKPGGQSFVLSAPRVVNGANQYNYVITVKNAAGTTIATANTSTSNPATAPVAIPQTSANYSITVTASVPPNNTPVGTYTASLTIQTGP